MVAGREYQYGTSPRKIEYKPTKKTVKKTAKKTTRKTVKKSNKKVASKNMVALNKSKAVITVALIFAAMFAVCYRSSLINQKFKDIQNVKKEYLALKTTNDQIEIGIQSSLDLTNIERHAKDKLGMQKAEAGQIKYIDIAKEDKVELSENITEKENIVGKVVGNVTKILD